jgi:phosphoribosylanthranilate isomerase
MTRVKICGVARAEDAELAVSLGAWAVGLIHHRDSPRFCPPEVAAEIAAALKRRCEVVGVFVNPALDEVAEAVEDEGLSMVQLHGDEGPSFCGEVARDTGCKVVKALRVHDAGDVQAAEAFRTDFHMFDARSPTLYGGTGETFDWGLLAGRRSEIPMLVSGGLTPDNVSAAIEATRPYAVDVASGVEAEPGRKDPELMRAFFEGTAAVPA